MKIAELKVFPSHVLFDLARNGSAKEETRKQAVEELIDRDDRRALHPELRHIADAILMARKNPVQKLNEKPSEKPAVEVIKNPTPAQKEEFFTDGKEAK
jgi:hypothetical protein